MCLAEAVWLDLSCWIAIRRLWAKGYARSNLGRRFQIEWPRASGCAGGGGTRRRALFRSGAGRCSLDFLNLGVLGLTRPEFGTVMDNAICVIHLGLSPGSGRLRVTISTVVADSNGGAHRRSRSWCSGAILAPFFGRGARVGHGDRRSRL